MSDSSDDIPSRVAFATPWFRIEEVPHQPGAGLGPDPYYRLVEPDGILSLVITAADEIVLVRQFRPPIGRHTLECPAGGLGDGEDPMRAVIREIHEETGHVCAGLAPLAIGRLKMNRYCGLEHFFLGVGATCEPGWRCDEAIEVVLVPRRRFATMILDREYEQIGALSIFTLARLKWGLDLLEDPLERIERRILAEAEACGYAAHRHAAVG
ncbi:MAG: NUDIX hydrolase [Alphaproteobacteria bacterium]|nr:NUDIX hydrolase [Alphaproteobacteria bacterium]